MSSQVLRISSGEMIQVRTGTIQGIGPQGPVGATGADGERGSQGDPGLPGPPGAVIQQSGCFLASSQAIASTTVTSNDLTAYTLVGFATVQRDLIGAQFSSSAYRFVPGDYQGNVMINFTKQATVNATGFRAVQVVYKNVVIASTIQNAVALVATEITLPFAFNSSVQTDQLQVMVGHNEGVNLNVDGRLWLNATGPGPKGDTGDQGVQGQQGIQGLQGNVGPAGSVTANTTTFATLGGDDS